MKEIEQLVPEYLSFLGKGPSDQFDWTEDIYPAMVYYNYVSENQDRPYTVEIFREVPYKGLNERRENVIYRTFLHNSKQD